MLQIIQSFVKLIAQPCCCYHKLLNHGEQVKKTPKKYSQELMVFAGHTAEFYY